MRVGLVEDARLGSECLQRSLRGVRGRIDVYCKALPFAKNIGT